MKKHQESRHKLALSRETLRRLEAAQLAGVAGGTVITCTPQCTTGFGPTSEETTCPSTGDATC
jgi:hypothetical protein